MLAIVGCNKNVVGQIKQVPPVVLWAALGRQEHDLGKKILGFLRLRQLFDLFFVKDLDQVQSRHEDLWPNVVKNQHVGTDGDDRGFVARRNNMFRLGMFVER